MAALRQLQVLRLIRCYSSSRVYDKGPTKNYQKKLQKRRTTRVDPRVDLNSSLLESLAKSEGPRNEDTETKEAKNDKIQKTLKGLLSGLETYVRPEEKQLDYDRRRPTPPSDERRPSDERQYSSLLDDRRRHAPISDDRRRVPFKPKPKFKLPMNPLPPVVTDPVNTSFTDGKRLGIFKIMTAEDSIQRPDPWSFREDQLQKEINFINEYKPLSNEFEELMRDSPRVWNYPIDNQLPSHEDSVGFEDHVFLMKHIEDKDLPKKGPVRHFMELVATGLSMNPYYTSSEKIEHIGWYKDYFKQFPKDELDLD